MPAIGTTNKPAAVERKQRKPRFTLPSGAPRGDAPQTRARDFRRANRHKKTKPYQAAIRTAYRNAPERWRYQHADRIVGKLKAKQRLSSEDRAVLKTLLRRARRDRMFMQSQIFNNRQRRIVERYKRTAPYLKALDKTQAERLAKKTGLKDWRLASTDPEQMKAAGLSPDFFETKINPAWGAAIGPLTSAFALGEGLVRSPLKTLKNTAKQTPLVVGGAITAPYQLAVHPKKMAESVIETLQTPYKEKVDRVINEGGWIDIGNAAIMLGPTSRAIGAMRMGNAPARAARLYSGGVTKTPKSRGAFRYTVGTAIDKAKAARYERIAAKDLTRETPRLSPLQREALLLNRVAGGRQPVAVVPARSAYKARRYGVAQPKGHGHAGLKFDIARGDIATMNRELMRLDKHERRALWFGTAAGIRTPEQAQRWLPMLKEDILKAREAKGIKPKGKYKRIDVVPLIDELLEKPEKHFTSKLDDVIERLREPAMRITEEEPQYAKMTKELGRRKDQAAILGLEQGVIPEEYAIARQIADLPDIKPGDVALRVEEYGKRSKGELGGAPEAVSVYPAGYSGVRFRSPEPPTSRTKFELNMRPDLKRPVPVPEMRYGAEADAEFLARIDAAARKEGLAAPLYFKSEKQRALAPDYAAYAVGGGKAKSTGLRKEMRNLEVGLFDTSVSQFQRGYLQNVKAIHNYDLMTQLVERNKLASLNHEPQGTTISNLLNRTAQAEPEIKEGSVGYINPGLYQKRLETAAFDPDNPFALADEGMDMASEEAMQAARYAPREVDALIKAAEAGNEEAILAMKTPGWFAVDKVVLNEIERQMKAGSMGGRVLDIAKGRASQAILLTLNAPWLALQWISEGGVTAAATRGSALNPVNWSGTYKWWKGMSHQQRREVASALSLGITGSDTATVRLGATTNAGFFNWYRGLKSNEFWHRPRTALAGHTVSQLSPVKLMAAADRGKTNVTRLLAAHSKLKREIVADMTMNMSKADAATAKLMSVFDQPAAKHLDYLQKHPGLLDDIADWTAEYLGDWTTMTARERAVANRMIMFYPYVRYSLRLLFYTLPVEHPAMAAILGELGQLQVNEYREIFGSDDLPWNLGKIYWGEDGNMKGIDLARANPLMNAPMSALARLGTGTSNIPGGIVGMLPPYGQWLVDQLTGVNTYKARPLRFHGETDPFWNKPGDIGLDERGKLLIAQVQSLFYPAREAMERLHPEAQSDESSLLFPEPMDYKASSEIEGGGLGNDIRRAKAEAAETQRRFREENRGGLGGLVFGPLWPTPNRDIAAHLEREYIKKLEREQERRRRQPGRYTPPKLFGGGGRGSLFK